MGYSKVWSNLSPEEKKIKRKEYRKTYELKHPERVKESDKRYKDKHKDILRTKASTWQKKKDRINKIRAIEYLGGQCTDCGGKFPPYVYDFHHLDPTIKDKTIAQIIGRVWEKIVPELDKCVLLCANCHKIRHNKDNF
jgi:hypothetical protein